MKENERKTRICPLCGKETSGETPTAEKVTVVPPLNR